MSDTNKTPKADLYQVVTNRSVTALESGTQPWRKPWNASAPDVAMGRPLRENGVAYTGINTVNLWLAAQSRGLANPYWLTWNRVAELGASVRKGAKSEMAFYVGSTFRRDGQPVQPGETVTEGEDGVRRISFLKYYRVFNASEIDDLPERYVAAAMPVAPIDHANPDAAAFIDASGATIRYGGNRAFYSTATDAITLPAYASFDPKAAFYATAFHELVHWTKHESRVNRDCGQVKRWGDAAYAMEELVAELGAAFLCADHGMANLTEDQSAAYLQGWLKALKEDNRAIFKAATMAEKAAGYLNALAAERPAPTPVTPAAPAPQPAPTAPADGEPRKVVVGVMKRRKGTAARPAPRKPAAAPAAQPVAKSGARKRPAKPAAVATRVEATVAAIVADLPAVEATKGRPVWVLTDDGAVPGELVNVWRQADDSLRLGARLMASQGRYKRGQCLFGDAGKIVPFGYLTGTRVDSFKWIIPATVAAGPVAVTEPAPATKPAKGGARKRPVPAPVADDTAPDVIRVRYAAIDGAGQHFRYVVGSDRSKAVNAARRFAHHWVGAHPEIGTGYAVAGDGVGKVTCSGITLAELFPDEPPAPPAPPVAPAPQPAPEAPQPVKAPRRRAAGRTDLEWNGARPDAVASDARKRSQTGRGIYAAHATDVADLAADKVRLGRLPVATCNGYDSFVAALAIAKAGAVAEAGLSWALKPGLSLMCTVPAKWVSCKVFGGTSRAPRDQRLPAPRFWPGGALPAGAIVGKQTALETAPILFGDDRAKLGTYTAVMAEQGWQFDAARGGWHRAPANDSRRPVRRAA